MHHAVCTLLLWLLTMVSLMASPPVEVRDSILLLSPIDPITTGETGECTEPDTAAVGKVWAHVGTACFANMGSTLCGSGYTANIPIAGARLLRADYYDDYEFLMAMPQEGIELCPDTLCHRGLQTGSVCATGNDGTYRVTKLDYDSEGRVMLTQTFYGSSNAAEVTAYTHDGRVAHRSILTAGPDGRTHTEDYRYSYDAQARLLRVTHSLDGGAERTLADNVYDALGRVSENRRGGSGMLTAHYSYDVRSRIREIASQLFSQRLYYAEPSEGGAPQYGGNISAMDWQALGDSLRGYRYAYDGMGRLVGADYREKGRPSDHYSTEYAYDLQSNILALRRNGRLYGGVYGVTDDLTYEYDGNRLAKVTNLAQERPAYKDAMYYVDGADLDTERAYDANGNMVSDADRQIARISYDRQNLPRRTDYLDGSHVDYTYDADGVKLRVDYELNTCSTVLLPTDEDIVCDSSACVHTWREYVGNCVYENDTLRMVLIDGGYITFDGASRQPLYHYYVKDYLGNNRVVADETGRIEETNHYYPFGGLMGDSRSTATQPYKYIGKELDRTHGLDWYDHGARHYDPVTGRWNVVDALAERYYSLSPYVSCLDNPINYLDTNGDSPVAAILEGVGAFVVSAGLDFLNNWILEGQDIKTAFSSVSWGTAVADGMSTAAISFFVDGTGSAKMYKTIANSKIGHIIIDIIQATSINVLEQIETRQDVKLGESFFNAVFSVIVTYGLSKKADELLGYLKTSNMSYYYAVNKLNRNIKAGKREKRISHDRTQVSVKKGNMLRATNKYVKRTTSNRLKGEIVTKLSERAKKEMSNEEKDKM